VHISATAVSFSYREITDEAHERIVQFMDESRRHSGTQSATRREWAYGVYMGWRTLVAGRAEAVAYQRDDQMLEALLYAP
jgi:hypothetical protein